jgi:hypothetical protein
MRPIVGRAAILAPGDFGLPAGDHALLAGTIADAGPLAGDGHVQPLLCKGTVRYPVHARTRTSLSVSTGVPNMLTSIRPWIILPSGDTLSSPCSTWPLGLLAR